MKIFVLKFTIANCYETLLSCGTHIYEGVCIGKTIVLILLKSICIYELRSFFPFEKEWVSDWVNECERETVVGWVWN